MSPLEQFDLIILKQYIKSGLDLTIFHVILVLLFILIILRRTEKIMRTYKEKGDIIAKPWQSAIEELYLVV